MERYQSLHAHAVQMINAQRWAEALTALEEMSQLAPDNATVAYNRALVHWRLDELAAAEQWLHRALELRADYAAAQQARTQILEALRHQYQTRVSSCITAEDWHGAHALLCEMTQRWPQEPSYTFHLAVMQQKVGDLDGAHARLLVLQQTYPNHAQVQEALAEVAEALRRRELSSATAPPDAPTLTISMPEEVAFVLMDEGMVPEEPAAVAPIAATADGLHPFPYFLFPCEEQA